MAAVGMNYNEATRREVAFHFGDRFVDSNHVKVGVVQRRIYKNRARRNGIEKIREIKSSSDKRAGVSKTVAVRENA